MDRALSHDDIIELLGAFALDAVDAEEAAAVEDHLATCPRCREEVFQYQQTAALLADPGGQAPAGLWDDIASRIARPAAAESAETAAPPLVARPGAPAGRRSRLSRPSRATRVVAGLAAVAVVAIAALGVEIGHLDHRINQVVVANGAQGLSQAARAALLDPTARRTVLKSGGPGAMTVAEVVTQTSGAAYLFNNGMPGLPDRQTYQLWAITGGRPVSLGLLGPDPTTVAFTVGTAEPTGTYAVTVEPSGGSVTPSGTPVATSA